MADESTDVRNIEQLVICILLVDKEITVCKEYIGLMPVTQTNADAIVVWIKDVLLCKNLRILDACGQCYDGYTTTTGTKNGLVHNSRK